MQTDKQLFQVFQSKPEWIFLLTGLPSPGPCRLTSFTVKALEGRADGLAIPDDFSQPLTVIEFQFQEDDAIYGRTVTEMAAVQKEHNNRPVQGVIVFRYPSIDPRTEPWTRVVHSYYLRDLLESFEAQHPGHPLPAVFQPVLITSEQKLKREAPRYYRQIKECDLDEQAKTAMMEVFVSWVEQRLKDMGKEEIEAMFLGELPELEETQSGKDMIRIGEKRGEKRGKQTGLVRAVLVLAEAKFGSLSSSLRRKISALDVRQLELLLTEVSKCRTLSGLERRLP